MNDQELERRLAKVSRRWTVTSIASVVMVKAGRMSITPGLPLSFLFVLLVQFRTLLDAQVWWRLKLPLFEIEVSGSSWITVLTVLCISNAWLLDRWCQRDLMSPHVGGLNRWVRFLISGLPLLGLAFILNLRGRCSGSRPRASPMRLDLRIEGPPRRRARRLWRWLSWLELSVFPLIWLLAVNFLVLWLALLWLATPRGESTGSILRLRVLSLIACLASIGMVRLWQNHWPWTSVARVVRYFSLAAWLFPMPVPLIALPLATRRAGHDPQTLSAKLSSNKTSLADARLFLMKRRETRRWQWRRRSSNEEVGLTEQRLISLRRLKVLALGVDSLLLGRLAVLGGLWYQDNAWMLDELLKSVSLGCAGLAGVGLLVALLCGLGLRTKPGGPTMEIWSSIAGYFILGSVSSLGGLLFGILLEKGLLQDSGALLRIAGAGWVALIYARMVIHPIWRWLWPGPLRVRDSFLWSCFALFLGVLGILIDTSWSGRIIDVIRMAALLSPVWNLGLALVFLKDFLRPFSLREALELRPRWKIAALLLTLAAPLGGLAIPFWIYARHRWWPGWERGWNPPPRSFGSPRLPPRTTVGT